MLDRANVQSFDWRVLFEIRRLAPELPTVCLTTEQRWLDNIRRDRPGPSPWTAGLDIDDAGGSVPRLVEAAGCWGVVAVPPRPDRGGAGRGPRARPEGGGVDRQRGGRDAGAGAHGGGRGHHRPPGSGDRGAGALAVPPATWVEPRESRMVRRRPPSAIRRPQPDRRPYGPPLPVLAGTSLAEMRRGTGAGVRTPPPRYAIASPSHSYSARSECSLFTPPAGSMTRGAGR